MSILCAVFPKEYKRFIEVFGSSGAVLLEYDPVSFEVYNDIDGELVNCFRVIRNRPAEFLLELGMLSLNSREEFHDWLHFQTLGCTPEIHLKFQEEIINYLLPKEWAKAMLEALHRRADYPEVYRAKNFLMRTRTSYSSSGRSFACQPFNVRTLFDQIWQMSERLENVVVENQSFDVLIPHYDCPDSFYYADLPYYNSEDVYDAEFNWEHHVLLWDTLAACKGKWLLSQADCPQIRKLFKDFDILDFKRIHSMVQKHTPGKQFHELLIGNYDLLERERDVPLQMSLNELLGEADLERPFFLSIRWDIPKKSHPRKQI